HRLSCCFTARWIGEAIPVERRRELHRNAGNPTIGADGTRAMTIDVDIAHSPPAGAGIDGPLFRSGQHLNGMASSIPDIVSRLHHGGGAELLHGPAHRRKVPSGDTKPHDSL